jgi:hypothetical protein
MLSPIPGVRGFRRRMTICRPFLVEVPMTTSLPVVNLTEARFECIYGRGCDGLCCQNGRPAVDPVERQRLDENLEKFLPHLRPEAAALLRKAGYASNRRKDGMPMLRVVGGWCIFFNQGCVLHKVGALEGDKYRYKPAPCALFPLSRELDGTWYVRQWGYSGEEWDLFCLNPAATTVPAAESLQEEIRLAAHFTAQETQDLPASKAG